MRGRACIDPADEHVGRLARRPVAAGPAATPAPWPLALSAATVLGLQRTAGNRAVVRALTSAGGCAPARLPVQRRTAFSALASIGAGAGLRPEQYHEYGDHVIPDPRDKSKTITVSVPTGKILDTKRRVVTSAGPGARARVYSQTAPLANSRLGALQQAARHNAVVGADVDRYAHGAGLAGAGPNAKWTRDPAQFDKETVPTVDPFFYEVTAPFTAGGARHVLDLLYQHAADFTGYVEGIYDSSNPVVGSSSFASMRDRGEDPLTATSEEDVRYPGYTNVHDVDKTATAPKLIDLTQGRGERNLDAYTKLAGEGARWQAVAKHAANLKDTSVFFTDEPTDAAKVLGVTFRQLWLQWKDAFGKAYDIPDATVAAQLQANAIRGTKAYWRWDLRATRDYDLVAGATYRLPYACLRRLQEGPSVGTARLFTADRHPRYRNTRWGVTAATLWRNWGPVFGHAADVSDTAVADAIWNYGFGRTNTIRLSTTDLRRGDDYNLDTGAVHR